MIVIADHRANDDEYDPSCLKSDCGWWDNTFEMCSIRLIGIYASKDIREDWSND